ncbi:MAG: hypothetical protein IJV15_00115 [Lachnospiraceae bacterium]|nr:hypothetical protein [Lachnospiraceae bacterium]
MSNSELIDYYRNRFQVVLLENKELQKQVELYKTLSTVKEDLIQEQNKVINALQRRLKLNDRIDCNRES